MISNNLAQQIAANLNAGGYPDVTPAMVTRELGLAPADRSIVGMFAHGMLEENGLDDEGKPLPPDADE